MIVVRALAPMTVMSDWITRSLLMLITPAGTLIVSAISFVASEAAIAARRLWHMCVSGLHVAAVARSRSTFHVSAWAGEATASAASPAMKTARTRTSATLTGNQSLQQRPIGQESQRRARAT